MVPRILAVVLTMLVAFGFSAAALADAEADVEAFEPAALPAVDSLEDALPGIAIHREQRYVDVQATVVRREGDWLELLACTPKGREHESLLTIEARPSHLHLALLLLNFTPGQPMQWEHTDDGYVVHPPRGDRLSLFIVHENDEGDTIETPANEWVRHEPTGETMTGNVWMFMGSTFERFEEREIYMADLNGTVISLVNFGDDLIGRPTQVTDQSDEQRWKAHTERIPEQGTQVKLRIRAFEGDPEAAQEKIDEKQEQVDGPPRPPGGDRTSPPRD